MKTVAIALTVLFVSPTLCINNITPLEEAMMRILRDNEAYEAEEFGPAVTQGHVDALSDERFLELLQYAITQIKENHPQVGVVAQLPQLVIPMRLKFIQNPNFAQKLIEHTIRAMSQTGEGSLTYERLDRALESILSLTPDSVLSNISQTLLQSGNLSECLILNTNIAKNSIIGDKQCLAHVNISLIYIAYAALEPVAYTHHYVAAVAGYIRNAIEAMRAARRLRTLYPTMIDTEFDNVIRELETRTQGTKAALATVARMARGEAPDPR